MKMDFKYIKPSHIFKTLPNKELDIKFKSFDKLFGKSYNLIDLNKGLETIDNKKILLDLKFNNDYLDVADQVNSVLQRYDKDKIIIQSMDLEGLSLMRMKYPEYNYLALCDKENDLEKARFFDNVGIRKNLIDYDYVKEFLDKNGTVGIWTIDSTKDVDKAVNELDDLYDDVIYVTDYPEVINYELNKTHKKKRL